VLGSLESGVDFEKEVLRIPGMPQASGIKAAFAALQKKMDEEIQSRLRKPVKY
jgi:hypothetical protein